MQKIKINLIILLSIAFILLFTIGCDKAEERSSQGIIVTSPEVAEIIAELGGTDLILARTAYCDYPPQMLQIESIGDFSTIDLERVIDLKPQMIFTAAFEQQEFYDKMKPFNIEVVKVHSNSIESYFKNIEIIAHKLNLSAKADELVADFRQKITNLTLPTNPPKVYFEISPNLGTVTDNSFIGDLIVSAGGINIFGEIKKDFLIAKNEDIVQANPDIIIALSYLSKQEISQRRGWKDISAVRNNMIYTIEDIDIDTVMRTVPRSAQALLKFNQWFLDYDKKQ